MFVMQLFKNPVYFGSVLLIVIGSICVHELFHALAAKWQGDDTAARAGHITLDPRVHMGQTSIMMLVLFGMAWGSTPVNRSRLNGRWSSAIVSFAGPFANLLLMTVSVVLTLGLEPINAALTLHGWDFFLWLDGFQRFFSLAALMNAFLFLLNMLPLPPLDGFDVLETFCPPLRRYSYSLSQYGLFILMILFFFGLSSVLFAGAGIMVFYTSVWIQRLCPGINWAL